MLNDIENIKVNSIPEKRVMRIIFDIKNFMIAQLKAGNSFWEDKSEQKRNEIQIRMNTFKILFSC